MAPWSLEQRLRRRLLAVLALLWLAGAAATLALVQHEMGEVLDSALQETAQRLLLLPDEALDEDDDTVAVARVPPHEEHVIYQVFDRRGRLQLRSHAAPEQPLVPPQARGLFSSGPWRVAALDSDDGRRRAVVAEPQAHRAGVLWRSSLWWGTALLALLALAALALQRTLRQAFAALEPVRTALAQRHAHELQPLPLQDAPRELQPLLETVNALMQRVQALLQAERAFAAHTAHELRTPLAAARAQAQRLAGEARDAGLAERAQALVRQLDRLATLATRLLQIARIEAGVALQRQPVDLAELARLVADEFGPARQRLCIEVQGAPPPVQGDVDALGIALRNLIDNALKHGGAQARVTVEVGPQRLGVSDDGPGVDAATLARLPRPFERGGSVAEGTGLGLALVAAIARQSDARLELQSPVHEGRGLRATLLFGPQPSVTRANLRLPTCST